MLQKNKGHIVGLASMASWVAPPGIVDYAATKAAVQALHEGMLFIDLYPLNARICLAQRDVQG